MLLSLSSTLGLSGLVGGPWQIQWEEGHVAERSAIPYPDKVVDYAEQEFRKMKTRQAELLGISNGRIRSKL
ncbi:hypothetical protein WJX84_002797 [Apatococcus fuscideae]|uniref:Uncharacterized protein n=1 Tax=Apatococcus fuscideae TaxID=2026836 RepID=A0AAW1RIS0_9CHLO